MGTNATPIAAIGVACWYPGAQAVRQFWENILARRREFRRIPDCRLPLSEYRDPTGEDPDKTYVDRAALIDGFPGVSPEFPGASWG
jgi:acyl transferase domain-containing protein